MKPQFIYCIVCAILLLLAFLLKWPAKEIVVPLLCGINLAMIIWMAKK